MWYGGLLIVLGDEELAREAKICQVKIFTQGKAAARSSVRSLAGHHNFVQREEICSTMMIDGYARCTVHSFLCGCERDEQEV